MEKEVKPYYEDDYQSLDEMSTIDLLEIKKPHTKKKLTRAMIKARRKKGRK
ncbi:MAG: hypothetical protein NNC23_03265 [Candidatus Nanosynbacter sp. P2B_S1_bin.0.1]|nr:hypothetical protein [Candidatus Nanosynbacter sp. P2B_S1_bin.0.1]